VADDGRPGVLKEERRVVYRYVATVDRDTHTNPHGMQGLSCVILGMLVQRSGASHACPLGRLMTEVHGGLTRQGRVGEGVQRPEE
jgi:hypothetical protein